MVKAIAPLGYIENDNNNNSNNNIITQVFYQAGNMTLKVCNTMGTMSSSADSIYNSSRSYRSSRLFPTDNNNNKNNNSTSNHTSAVRKQDDFNRVHSFTTDDDAPRNDSSGQAAVVVAAQQRTSPRPSMEEERKNRWLQMCVVRQTASFLTEDRNYVISESPFLQRHHQRMNNNNNSSNNSNNSNDDVDDERIPLFHRSEIITGRLLGRGGFSEVYEITGYRLDSKLWNRMTPKQRELRRQAVDTAIDPKTGRGRFAIKHLRKDLLLKSIEDSYLGINEHSSLDHNLCDFHLAASDLAAEAMYLSALNHPGIVNVRGLPYCGVRAYLDGNYDSYFLICDRLQDTLDDRINETWNDPMKTPPTVMQKAEYALQLADALQYLHHNRIMFRDLKPQNIGFSVDDPNRMVLFDFGLCRELPTSPAETSSDALFEMSGVGTRRYMAPELINYGRYNLKADVYSWSMVFWEMLTHTRPYSFHSVEDHRITVCQSGERPLVFKNQWPVSIQHVLKQSWKEEVNERYDIDEVCKVMERILRVHYNNKDLINDDKENSANVVLEQQHGMQLVQDRLIIQDRNHGKPPQVPIINNNSSVSSKSAFKKQTLYETIFGTPKRTEDLDSSDSTFLSFEPTVVSDFSDNNSMVSSMEDSVHILQKKIFHELCIVESSSIEVSLLPVAVTEPSQRRQQQKQQKQQQQQQQQQQKQQCDFETPRCLFEEMDSTRDAPPE